MYVVLGTDLDIWRQELFFGLVCPSLSCHLFMSTIIIPLDNLRSKISRYQILILYPNQFYIRHTGPNWKPSSAPFSNTVKRKKKKPTQLTYVLLNIKSKMKFLSPASRPYKTVCHLIKKTIPFKNFKVAGNLFFKEFHHRNQWVSFWNLLLS